MAGLKITGEIGLDGAGFERGLNRLATASVSSFRNMVAGAFGIVTVQQAFKKTMDTADELVNSAKRLGMTVEKLQVLRQAAKDSNVELATMARAFEKINDAREEALSGSEAGKKLMSRFAQLGIGEEDLRSQTASQLLLGPIRDQVKSRSPEDVGPILKDIIGSVKGFGEILPVLSTDFEALEAKMRKLGTLMDTETAVALDMLGDNLSMLSSVIVVKLGPAIIQLAFWILQSIAKIRGTMTFFERLSAEVEGRTGQKPGKMEIVAAMAAFNMSSGTDSRRAVPLNKDWLDAIAAADDAGSNVLGDEMKKIEELKKKIDEEAAKLKNPATPVFTPDDRSTPPKKQPIDSGDSLVRVGNFLGSNQQSIVRLQERQISLLQQIEKNTKQKPFVGDAMGTQFLNYT